MKTSMKHDAPRSALKALEDGSKQFVEIFDNGYRFFLKVTSSDIFSDSGNFSEAICMLKISRRHFGSADDPLCSLFDENILLTANSGNHIKQSLNTTSAIQNSPFTSVVHQ